MKNMKTYKFNKITLILILLVLAASIAISSYAIYKLNLKSDSDFKTAAWNIKVNDDNIVGTNTLTFDLGDALWTHSSNITPKDDTAIVIAPGSVGTYEIEIDTEGTEVTVLYSVSVAMKQKNTDVDLSTINENFTFEVYKGNTLLGNPGEGSIVPGEKENLVVRIIWNQVDSSVADAADVAIKNNDLVVEVTVTTKQKAHIKTAAERLTANVTELVDVADALRYVGSSPNNYIWFNNELWRIIGIYGDQLKIIKASVHTQRNSYGSGSDEWEDSSILRFLDGYYYDRYLSEEARALIDENAEWNVAGFYGEPVAEYAFTSAKARTWNGRIGLLSVYEYLYAASSECWTVNGFNYGYGCAGKDWLFRTITVKDYMNAMFTTRAYYSNFKYVFVVYCDDGSMNRNNIGGNFYYNPVVYLKSSVVLTGGTGTYSDPYTVSL